MNEISILDQLNSKTYLTTKANTAKPKITKTLLKRPTNQF